MGTSTISITMFNSYVSHNQRVNLGFVLDPFILGFSYWGILDLLGGWTAEGKDVLLMYRWCRRNILYDVKILGWSKCPKDYQRIFGRSLLPAKRTWSSLDVRFFLWVKTMVSCRFFDQSLEPLVSSSAQLRLREDLEVRSQLRRQCGMGPWWCARWWWSDGFVWKCWVYIPNEIAI